MKFADSGGLENGTFSKCNNPLLHFHPYWLQSAVGSPRALPRGYAVTAATSTELPENCLYRFLLFSPDSCCFAKHHLSGGSEKQIFHCHRNSPNKGNELFLSRAFHALLLCTYVPAIGFTQHFAIPPECHPVRTYTANLRKTHLYEVVQSLPLP